MFKEIYRNKAVTSYLIGDDIVDHVLRFLKVAHLDVTREGEIYTLITAVMRDEVTLEELPELLGQAFGIERSNTRIIAEQFIGYILLPLIDFVPQIHEAFQATSITDYPDTRLSLPAISSEEAIKNVLDQAGVRLEDPNWQNRLTLILTQYLKKERNAQKTEDLLMRDVSIGGLSLTQEIARSVVRAVDEYVSRGVRIKGVQSVDQEHTRIQKSKAPIVTKADFIQGQSTLVDDVSLDLSEQMTVNVDAHDTSRDAHDVKVLTQKIQDIKELLPLDEPSSASPTAQLKTQKTVAIKSSVQNVVATTRALAASIPMVAGDLMTEEERAEVDQHRMPASDAAKTSQSAHVSISEEARHLTDTFWPRIKNSSLTKTALGQLIDTVLREVRTVVAFETQLKDRFRIDPMMAEILGGELELALARRASRIKSTAISSVSAGAQMRVSTLSKPVVPTPPPLPAPVKVEVSAPSIHKSKHGEQKVTDIVYQKQTLGPVDELGTMTLGDFRLLASRTQDIPDILLAKINTISELGFEERLKAIEAWKRSPIHMQYVRLLRESMMTQKPIPEVLATARAKGEEVLNPAEMDAVMAVNKRISA